MANRFERGIVYNAPLQWHQQQYYTPDFKMWAGAIDKQQTDYDMANKALSALKPNALPEWQEDANRYSQQWKDKASELTDVYINQGVAAGNRMRNKLMRDVQNEVSDPQSEYNALNTQTKKYTEERERLKKFHEKDPVKDNLAHSLRQLDSQVGTWDKHYDKNVKSLIKGIADVTATPFVDIESDWREHVKSTKIDGYDVQWVDNKMIYTKSGKGVDPNRAKEIFDSFMQSSKYAGQLDVYTSTQMQGQTPENYAERNNKFIEENKKALVTQYEDISKGLNSSDVEQRKEAQAKLTQLGYYKGAIDGDVKKLSKTALQEYKKASDRRAEQLSKSMLDPTKFNEEDLKTSLKAGIVENYRDQFTRMYGYETSETTDFNKKYLQNLKDAAANKRNDAYLAKLGSLSQPFSPGLASNASPKIAAEFEERKKEVTSSLEKAKNNIAENSQKILSPILGFDVDEENTYDILNSIKDATSAAERAGVPFDYNILIDKLSENDIIVTEEQAQQLVRTMTGETGQVLNNSLAAAQKAEATLKAYEEYTAGRQTVYRQTKGQQELEQFGQTDLDFKGVSSTTELSQKAEEYKAILNEAEKEIRALNNAYKRRTGQDPNGLIQTSNRQAVFNKNPEYRKAQRAAGNLKNFLIKEEQAIKEHELADPNAYKSLINTGYTNTNNKSVMHEFSNQLVGAMVNNPSALRGFEKQNLEWSSSTGNEELSNSEVKLEDATVGFYSVAGEAFFQLSTEKAGEPGKIYTAIARVDDIHKQTALNTAKAELLQVYQSNDADESKLESLSNFITALEGTGKDASEIQAINNASITENNTIERMFDVGGAKMFARVSKEPVDERTTEVALSTGQIGKMNLKTYAVGEVGGKRNFVLEKELVSPDGQVLDSELVTLENGRLVPATMMNVKKPSIQAVDKQFKLLEVINDPKVQQTVEAVPKGDIPVELKFNRNNLIDLNSDNNE